MKVEFEPEKPTYLMSPPPHCWRAAGNAWSARANLFHGGTNPKESGYEWLGIANKVNTGANVVVMMPGRHPQKHFDKTYTADLGAYFPDRGFYLSNPEAPHRAEEPAYAGWFLTKKLRLKVLGQAKNKWEGSSCVRLSPNKTFAVLGYGVRADRASCDEIASLLGVPTLRIKMKDPHIHLDTLFASLRTSNPLVVVCRAAFAEADDHGWSPDVTYERLLEWTQKEDSALECVSTKDGEGYATNIREEPGGQVYAVNGLTPFYSKILKAHGYKVHPFNLPRLFGDGGGAAACLTNDLTQAVAEGWRPPAQYLFGRLKSQIEAAIEKYPERQLAA